MGASRAFVVRLKGRVTLRALLAHLYVLLPVLDDEKHYWVGHDELEKLLAHGGTWLKEHPEKETITRRYLRHLRFLADEALERLTADDPLIEEGEAQEDADVDADVDAGAVVVAAEALLERPLSLNERRLQTVVSTLVELGATRVIDLGCGEGKLLRALLRDRSFTRVVGVDVSVRALTVAKARLRFDELTQRQRERIELVQGSLTYTDRRFAGFDAAACVEVIEHLEPSRLPAFERVVFHDARPPIVLVTTPNAEHNVRFEGLAAGAFRHKDHRFEWSRAEFLGWARRVGDEHGYHVAIAPIGDVDDVVGPPTQMAIFRREAS